MVVILCVCLIAFFLEGGGWKELLFISFVYELSFSCKNISDSIFISPSIMGKLNIFEITLSNFQGVFYAGQNVQGHCTVELNDEMSMRG